ncbi:MAG TPA: hypothetical protein PLL78_09600 [Fimbriimonadaceae bacterium]|nr:hypothetical protein [Fimbriimonadaceae bacterium]HRJ96928.1 hypothetical protein [Fimbriimonadaceae bacterium]
MMMLASVALSFALQQGQELDAIVHKLYGVISGPAGKKRDWDAFRTMFAPDARMRVAVKREGKSGLVTLTPDDYVVRSGPMLEERGFFEREIARKVLSYGGLVHVWSTYESRWKEDDTKPFDRGINSIQLVNIDGTWKIVAIAWASESSAGPIPSEFLKPGQ